MIGIVVASRHSDLVRGDPVAFAGPWRLLSTLEASQCSTFRRINDAIDSFGDGNVRPGIAESEGLGAVPEALLELLNRPGSNTNSSDSSSNLQSEGTGESRELMLVRVPLGNDDLTINGGGEEERPEERARL